MSNKCAVFSRCHLKLFARLTIWWSNKLLTLIILILFNCLSECIHLLLNKIVHIIEFHFFYCPVQLTCIGKLFQEKQPPTNEQEKLIWLILVNISFFMPNHPFCWCSPFIQSMVKAYNFFTGRLFHGFRILFISDKRVGVLLKCLPGWWRLIGGKVSHLTHSFDDGR